MKGRKRTGAMYDHAANVTGSGLFPVDMLRYDGCYPATEADAELMGTDHAGERRTIRLSMISHRPDAGTAWEVDRWKSFGWTLAPVQLT